jgi:flagellar motor switch protein FliG
MADETTFDAEGATPTEPTGSEAAAILLMLLGEEEAATVLSRLDPDEVQHLGGAMFGVADITETEIDGVFDVFVERARVRTTLGGFGADRQIKGIMHKALGQEKADQVLQRITPVKHVNALENLKWMDAPTIANLIEHEHPQIAALVLAFLDPQVAADVLQLLAEDIQADLVYRVATLGPVTEQALNDVSELLSRPTTTSASASTTKRGGAGEAAKIVNSSRKAAEQRIIKALQKLDKTMARTIEDEMFIFDNLMNVSEKDLGTLLRAVDSDILVVSLKGADEKLRAKIFGCMSSRAAQTIQDEIADRGPMRLAEVQEAQKNMLGIARKLATDGAISLGGKGDDYV